MLDSVMRKIIDLPLNKTALFFKSSSITGTHITLIGFCFGLTACAFAFTQDYMAGIIFLTLNRICDGLDGPIARARGEASDFGGYLDILLDFVIYAGFPFTVGLGIGTIEAISATAFALFSIIGTGVSFLTYATICAKRGIETELQGKKTFYFSNGLMEGTETIIFMVSLCIFPHYFVPLCMIFGTLCILTTILRIRMAYQVFTELSQC